MEYFGIFFIPVFWVFIAYSYHPDNPTYNENLLKRLHVLYIIPLILNPIVWTNDWHHLIYHDIRVNRNLPISLLEVDRAPGFWVINGIIVILYLFGTIRMIYNLVISRGNHRKQYLLLTLAAIPPFISYLLILSQAIPYGLDINPLAFALSGLLLFWGMDNLQLFNILPIAQNMVIEAMHDALMVVDTKGRLVECNMPAKLLFGNSDSSPIMEPLGNLNPHLSLLLSHSSPEQEVELVLAQTDELRTFSIYSSPIIDRRNRIRGNLYLLHDLTEIRNYVKELEHLASSDGLTNLLNHRQFMNLAAIEAKRLQTIGFGEFSLVMFDLDHFKFINDSYGHHAGDEVLQHIGLMVSQHARENDLCARYGGEEFVILLSDTSIDQATNFAQELCFSLAHNTIPYNETNLNITASFGVSTYSPECDIPWEIILNQADTALYRAKAAGRNRVITYQSNNYL
jgi:diguanylate cyclase (GGDEF)-like protein